MLTGLHVKNLAIIDEVEISFGSGLNILTGETGAGKSIIIGSINLALGAKAGKGLIRKGAESAFVELIFSVNDFTENKLKEMDIAVEDGLVTIGRRFSEERNISRINGETVTLTKVREAASVLLDIHGQQENQSLLSTKNHLEILDRYANKDIEVHKAELKCIVKSYREKKEELEEYDKDIASVSRELDFLKFEYEEIENADIKEGEEEELEKTVKKYVSLDKTVSLISEAERRLNGDSGIQELLGGTVRIISKLNEIDEEASGLFDQISDIESLLGDFGRSLSDYADENVIDEEDFAYSEERLDKIRSIFAKHGGSYNSTFNFFEKASEKIEKLEHFEEYRERLVKETEELNNKILKKCDEISKIRKKAAKDFTIMVKNALADLNFLQVEFETEFKKTGNFTAKGNDEVRFLISANPGEPLMSISEIASGGELSRIMLAIKSVMADTDEIPTLIFDEIDTGISGRTAQKVSEKLAVIAKNRQVIAITHLAQIAAMADRHFLIEKSFEGERTSTGIRELNEKDSITELARISGGAEITDTVLAGAKEMKRLASEIRERMRRK